MKLRQLVIALEIGAVLTIASLLITVGQKPPMLPCAGVGRGCVLGTIVYAPDQFVTGHRGWPLPMMYLQKDAEDGESFYEGYSVTGILGDFAIYTIASFGAILLFSRVKKPAKK